MSALAALWCCAAFSSACRSLPGPPSPLAFALEGQRPRVLTAAREVTVPLTVTNRGTRAWDPARVHLSYHWLWIVPRELASRSRWNLPYQSGIRTGLAAAVAPGARASIAGRLLAPAIPGVYWLQWDMVEEGVTWFVQVAPRQPRSLVVVVPPLVWVLAPVPLLIVIAGITLVRLKPDPTAAETPSHGASGLSRTAWTSPFSVNADLLWCAAALFCKPFVIIHDALLEPTPVACWLTSVVAVAIPAVAGLVLPRRARVWTLLATGLFASLLIAADVVYYRFFGDVLSTPALLGAHQTGRVWGSIRSLFTPGLLWLVADWPFAIWMAVRLSRLRARATPLGVRAAAAVAAALVLATGGLLLSAPRVLASAPLDQMFRDRAIVEQLGPFGYHAYDAWNYARSVWWRPAASEADVQDALAWFTERAPLREGEGGPAFGAARGGNLIVIQVESLQDFAVDFTVGGQDVMPHLRRWIGDGLRFTNVTDQTSEGRTSDAELTTMASLLPLDHGAAAFRYPGHHYVGLPGVLREHGYTTLSAVPFEPGFWNRQVMHPAYGFERTLFEPDFQLTEQIGWGLNDRDFLQQMVPRLERLDEPFAAWMITLSLHHPFEDFPARHRTLKLGALEGTAFGNYLHAMHFFDAALEAFTSALARDGLLERSVLVVFGDHDAGFAPGADLAATMHAGADDASWTLNDRVPWFIRAPDPDRLRPAAAIRPSEARPEGSRLRGAVTVPAGQTDFAPTVLGLLGIDAAWLPYVGRNLLGAPRDAPVVRPYGDWLDAHHLFLTRGTGHVCYDLARGDVSDGASCREADRSARRARDISRLVVVDDLQQRLREALERHGGS